MFTILPPPVEQNYSLFLIDSKNVSYCRWCQRAVVHSARFDSRHRLFTINQSKDLAVYLGQALTAFPSSIHHPHFITLKEAADTRISRRLKFKDDFGTLLEAFAHFSIDLSLSECEPNVCNLIHIKFNQRPSLHLSLNLDNCSGCTVANDTYANVEDYSACKIPSWRPKEVAKEPACSIAFRLQQDIPWTKDFIRDCYACKRRRLLRSEYTLGLRRLWTSYYSEAFCTCSFECFGGF